MQSGNFKQAFWSGALGSLGASAFNAIAGETARSTLGTIGFGAVSGGIGAELSGGNFWQGAVIGGVVAGLKHAMHKIYPPKEFKGEVNGLLFLRFVNVFLRLKFALANRNGITPCCGATMYTNFTET